MQLVLLHDDSQLVTQVVLYTLIPFVIAFSFIFFIFYRQNRENQLRKNVLDLELKAIRAQMNPHFIFNCLNSIYYCIKKGKHDMAGDYLLKFSFLTRRVLENSGKRWIALEEDIEMLKAYLDLERLRTADKFTYSIDIASGLDCSNTSVPMLLVQPFVENSIWHGFSGEIVLPHIAIHIEIRGESIHYLIEDNGTKEVHATFTDDIKKNSMGTGLVNEQLKAIRELHKGEAGYTLADSLDETGKYKGKRVDLYLPHLSLH